MTPSASAIPQAKLPPMQAKSNPSEVYDSFYELFLYEAIEQLIIRHKSK